MCSVADDFADANDKMNWPQRSPSLHLSTALAFLVPFLAAFSLALPHVFISAAEQSPLPPPSVSVAKAKNDSIASFAATAAPPAPQSPAAPRPSRRGSRGATPVAMDEEPNPSTTDSMDTNPSMDTTDPMEPTDPSSIMEPSTEPTLSVLSWNILSVGLRNNLFDVDPEIYRTAFTKLRRILALSEEEQPNHADLLEKVIPNTHDRAMFLVYAAFRARVRALVGDWRLYDGGADSHNNPNENLEMTPEDYVNQFVLSVVGSGTTVVEDLESSSIDSLLDTRIDHLDQIGEILGAEHFSFAADEQTGSSALRTRTWRDFVARGGSDPFMGNAMTQELDLVDGKHSRDVLEKLHLSPHDQVRLKAWGPLTTREWLVNDRKIYADGTLKSFSLSQADKFIPARITNSWQYKTEHALSPKEVRSTVTKTASNKLDLLKLRVYDLLMLKMLYDTFVDLGTKWTALGFSEDGNGLPPGSSPISLWEDLKTRSGAALPLVEEQVASVFGVLSDLQPDIVLLQEVDKRWLFSKNPVLETQVEGVAVGSKAPIDKFVAGKIVKAPVTENVICSLVDRATDEQKKTGSFGQVQQPYIALYDSEKIKGPDNSVILVRKEKLRSVEAFEAVGTTERILTVRVKLALNKMNPVREFRLGSYHFSSGHASTKAEFQKHIFRYSTHSLEDVTLPVNILGGDLNTVPSTSSEIIALESEYPYMARVTPSDAMRPTYAKTLSVLQTQVTKADRMERDTIDHIYVSAGQLAIETPEDHVIQK